MTRAGGDPAAVPATAAAAAAAAPRDPGAATPAKVCGIRTAADARLAVEAGARALGFILYAESPRAVDAAEAARVMAALDRPFVAVGVFVHPSVAEVERALAVCDFDAVQLSGDEPPALVRAIAALGRPVLKAVRLAVAADLDPARAYADFVHALLVEPRDPAGRFGGTGRTADWGLARAAVARLARPIVLAGGLRPENVEEAIRGVGPAAVDVCSGVEASPGRKDAARVEAFLAAVRRAPLAPFASGEGGAALDAFGCPPRIHDTPLRLRSAPG